MAGEELPNQPDVGRVRPSAAERELLNQASSDEGDRAAAEARQIGSGRTVQDLQQEAQESDHYRSEAFRDQFELAIILMMWVAIVGFLMLAAVWAINLCVPTAYRWLTPDEMHDLQGILTGGLLIGLVSDHVKRRMAFNHSSGGTQ